DPLSTDCTHCQMQPPLQRLNQCTFWDWYPKCTRRGRVKWRAYVRVQSVPPPDESWKVQKIRGYMLDDYVAAWDGTTPGQVANKPRASFQTALPGTNHVNPIADPTTQILHDDFLKIGSRKFRVLTVQYNDTAGHPQPPVRIGMELDPSTQPNNNS